MESVTPVQKKKVLTPAQANQTEVKKIADLIFSVFNTDTNKLIDSHDIGEVARLDESGPNELSTRDILTAEGKDVYDPAVYNSETDSAVIKTVAFKNLISGNFLKKNLSYDDIFNNLVKLKTEHDKNKNKNKPVTDWEQLDKFDQIKFFMGLLPNKEKPVPETEEDIY